MKSLTIALISAHLVATAAASTWKFGEPLRWNPEGLNWRNASVLNRYIHLVNPLRYRYIWDADGFRVRPAPPSLLENPRDRARFNTIPPVGATFWDAASTEVLGI